MLANSVFLALKDAVAAAGGHRASPHLNAPATPERVLAASCMRKPAVGMKVKTASERAGVVTRDIGSPGLGEGR